MTPMRWITFTEWKINSDFKWKHPEKADLDHLKPESTVVSGMC